MFRKALIKLHLKKYLNNKRIKILKAEVIHEKGEAGKIMNEEFLIGCGINSIRPLLLRVEGKQDLPRARHERRHYRLD